MALSNFGSVVLNLLIFITTLVNFSFALTSLGPLTILAATSLPRWLNLTIPENGYESPGSPENGQIFFGENSWPSQRKVKEKQERRGGWDGTDESYVAEVNSGPADTSRSNHSLDVPKNAFEGPGKIGLRQRSSCYQWTLYTMTM
ncbi:hypothetical protein B2J93_2401 [Marssonina coronariae]|uniref:Uncharacterized protein n=1 Tax=Diplocarpon coronariae TaxID=2795749 RepID=A0A218Z170_9HELO|nr:hypothetical protein B2J93_2401 [Marssonina coronariae]